MICVAFFLQILPKLHFISTPWSDLLAVVTTELLQLWWLSHVVGPGFEPLLHHTFFAINVSRKISRCLAGVLLFHEMLHIAIQLN